MKRCKYLNLVSVLLLFTFSICQAGCTTQSRADAPRLSDDLKLLGDEVAGRCQEMELAMRHNDLLKVASFYTDDAILMSKSGNKRGGNRQAIDEYWKSFGTGIDWSLSVDSIEGEDSLIVHHGRSELTYIRNGQRRISKVKFMLLWLRSDDGILRITFDAYW